MREDVALMREVVGGPTFGVKASGGGVRDNATARAMIKAGGRTGLGGPVRAWPSSEAKRGGRATIESTPA